MKRSGRVIQREEAEAARPRLEAEAYPDPNSGCLLFAGPSSEKGYGRITIGSSKDGTRRHAYAHRIAAVLAGLELKEGSVVRHVCDTPCCINPDHLRQGSALENSRDMAGKNRGTRGQLPFGVARIRKKYTAKVNYGGRSIYLGVYETAEEAASVAQKAKAALAAPARAARGEE